MIKPEEALEVLDFDLSKYESADDFKQAVEKRWVARDTAHNDKEISGKVFGKINRVMRSKLSKISSVIGAEMDDSADPIDVLDTFIPVITDRVGEVETWKKKAESAVADEVVKEWQGKVKNLEKENNAFKSQAQEWQEKYNGLDNEVKTSRKKSVVDSEWNAAISAIPFHAGVDDLRKKGFIAVAKDKYRIDLDEEFKPHMVGSDGNPIKHPKQAGKLLDLGEALKELAKEHKMIAENPHANRPAPAAFGGRQAVTAPAQTSTTAPARPRRFGVGK